MANFDGKFLRGVLGAYIFRVVNGKQRVSLKPLPGTVNQAKETERASNTFGMASSLGQQIRGTVSTQISHFNDGALYNRLNGKLIQILNECRDTSTKLYHFEEDSFSGLNGLEYNENWKVEQLMLLRPQVNVAKGQLVVVIPELSIAKQLKFPGETFQCRISICVSLFRLRDGKAAKVPEQQELVVTREKKVLNSQQLVFEVPDGCLCVVSLFLEYSIAGKNGWEPVNNKMFNPGYICRALITPGVYQEKKRRAWLKMVSFPM